MLRRHFVLVFLKMSRDKNLQDFWRFCTTWVQRWPGSSPDEPPFWKSRRRRPWGRGWVMRMPTELKNDCASHWSAARNAGSRARSFKKTICSLENDSCWLNQKNKVTVWKIRILSQFLTSFDVSPKIEVVYKLCKNCFRAVNAPFVWLYGEWR